MNCSGENPGSIRDIHDFYRNAPRISRGHNPFYLHAAMDPDGQREPRPRNVRTAPQPTGTYGSVGNTSPARSASVVSEDGGHPDVTVDDPSVNRRNRRKIRRQQRSTAREQDDEKTQLIEASENDTQFNVDSDDSQLTREPPPQQSIEPPQQHGQLRQPRHQAPVVQQQHEAPVGQPQHEAPVEQQQYVEIQGGRKQRAFDCCIIGTPAALQLACVVLIIYVGVMVHHVNSDKSFWFSTTENLSLSALTHNQQNWYAREVCIKELTQEQLDHLVLDQVTISLDKKPCKDVNQKKVLRVISKNFTSDRSPNALLNFFWISKTSVSFQVNITSNTTVGYLGVYITHTDDQWRECEHHSRPTGDLVPLVFNFDGSSTDNVKCTLENSTSICISSAVVISKTQRYHVCMHYSAQEIDHEQYVKYDLLADEVTYDLTDICSCESITCRLNESDCCVSYNNLWQEMFKPTCVFLQNTAVGSDNQARDLPFPFTITSHKKWDAVIYATIPTILFSLLLFLTVLCVIIRTKYRNKHPNQYLVELKLAARSCLRL